MRARRQSRWRGNGLRALQSRRLQRSLHHAPRGMGAAGRRGHSGAARERGQRQRYGHQRCAIPASCSSWTEITPHCWWRRAAPSWRRCALPFGRRARVAAYADLGVRLASRDVVARIDRARAVEKQRALRASRSCSRNERAVRSRNRSAAPGQFAMRFGGGKALHAAAVRALARSRRAARRRLTRAFQPANASKPWRGSRASRRARSVPPSTIPARAALTSCARPSR